MASIENKVVTMNFNNGEFEKNISKSMTSLADLQKSLQFKDAGKGFADISSAANGVKLDGIASSIEGIQNKFSAMSVVAITAIANITSKAVDAGLQLAKAFTIAPIGAGFDEYELKLGAIQTIMAGSGESLETVNKKLAELNAYSDQTIYSFKDMTSNIGKFTNAGLSLDDSVASIQGIANVAALSGANAEEASRAMYNFAQSLSSGSVKLMDWKSIELANMATVEFKTELLESAVAAGTLTKSADGLYTTLEGTPVSATKGFNESLEQQWLTTQALNDTLARYSDETTDIGARATAAATQVKTFSQMMDTLKESAGSGWAQTSELIFGNFDEAKSLFTGMNDLFGGMISASAESRNKVLQDWRDLGGRDELFQGLLRIFDGLRAILRPISEAFRDIFPKKTGEDLFRWSVMINDFGKALQNLDPNIIKNIALGFKGFFAIVSIGWNIIKGVAGVIFDIISLFVGGTGGGLLAVVGKVGAAFVKLHDILVSDGGIARFFDEISQAITGFIGNVDLSPVGEAFDWFVSRIKLFVSFFESGFKGISGTTEIMADRLGGVAKVAYEVGMFIAGIAGKIKDFFGALDFGVVTKAIDILKAAIAGLFGGGGGGEEGVVPAAAGESVSRFAAVLTALAGVATAVASAIGTALSAISSIAKGIGNVVGEVAGALKDVWSAVATALGNGESPDMTKIFAVLGGGLLAGLTAALLQFAKNGFKIDIGQFAFFEEVTKSLDSVRGVLKAMQTDIIAGALLKIAAAIGVLTLSLIALSFIDGIKLAKSMTAVSAGVALLVGAMAGLDKVASGEGSAAKIALLAISMTAIAGAMLLLAIAATMMATSDPIALSVGILGMVAALKMMAIAMEDLTKNTEGIVKAAFAVGVLAVSLMLFSLAIRTMAGIDLIDLGVGILAISVSLDIIAKTLGTMPADGMVKAALAVGLLSAALILLAFAIKQMSDIGLVDTATGLATMAISLKIVGDVLKKISNPDVLKAGAALLLMSFGIKNLATGIERLGSIDFITLVKGLAAMAVLFTVIGKSMDAAKQSLGGGVALLLVSAAIYGFALAIEKMAAIPFFDMVKGLGAVVVGLVAISGTAYLIAAAVPVIAALGAGLALIGLAAAGFGAGVFLIAKGVELLAKAGPEGVAVFLESLDDILKALPKVAAAFGEFAFEFVTSFLSGFDTLIPMVVDLLKQLLEAVAEMAPELFDTAYVLIAEFLGGVRAVYPELVKTGLSMILALLQGIEENIGPITESAIGIVTNFITAMATGIPGYVSAMVNLWVTLLTTVVGELGYLIPTLVPSLGIAFIDGILQGIKDTIGNIQAFFGEWFHQIIDFIKGLFGIKSPSTVFAEIGTFLIDGLLKGIVDTIVKVADFFNGLFADVLRWIGDTAVWLVTKGANLITGFWNGINNTIGTISAWAIGLGAAILGWIGDTLLTLKNKGVELIRGFWNGITERVETLTTWFENLGDKILSWIGNALLFLYEAGKDIVRGLWDGITSMGGWLADKITGFIKDRVTGVVDSVLSIFSPSRVMAERGKNVVLGLAKGMVDNGVTLEKASASMANSIIDNFQPADDGLQDAFNKAFEEIVANMDAMDGMQPVITPVLDLTGVQKDAKALSGLFGDPNLNTNYGTANLISASTLSSQNGSENSEVAEGPSDLTFVQNNYSPTALSTGDIYRNTRSQFALVKEELRIP